MTLRLRGSTSGYAEINAPAVAGDNSLTLPTTAGTIRITNPSGVDGDYTVATGATISGSTNEVIVNANDASSTTLRLRSDGGGANGGHLEGEGPRISFDAKRSADGAYGGAAYIKQVAIGDLGSSFPVDLAFGVRRFGGPFEALRILSNGNVGIGTDATTSKLHINGTVRSDEGYTVYPPSDSNYAFATRNAADDQWTAFIEASGQATFAGNLLLNGANDVRIELGSNGTTATNDRNHLRADGDNMKYNCCDNGQHIFEQNGTQRFSINASGDARFDGNLEIDAPDVYYTNTYEMDSTWTSYQTITSALGGNSVYLVSVNWNHGSSANQPYYYTTSFIFSTSNGTNGTGGDNEKTFLHATHTGSPTSYFMTFRVKAQAGSQSVLQAKINTTWPGAGTGNALLLSINKLMSGTRSI